MIKLKMGVLGLALILAFLGLAILASVQPDLPPAVFLALLGFAALLCGAGATVVLVLSLRKE